MVASLLPIRFPVPAECVTETVSAGTVFLPSFSTSIFISEVWPTNCCDGKLARVTFPW